MHDEVKAGCPRIYLMNGEGCAFGRLFRLLAASPRPSIKGSGACGVPEKSGASTAHGSLNGVAVGFPQHPGRVLRNKIRILICDYWQVRKQKSPD